jgi:predicted DCC family thiol-disulfide oxidoreductase YuxK
MLKVLYDGKCGICRKEINYYQGIAKPEKFEWLDVTEDDTVLKQNHISLADALMELHSIDAEGNVFKGVASFVQIWQRLPYWHLLAKIAALPVINPVLQKLYRIFAERRFKKLSHCQASLSQDA